MTVAEMIEWLKALPQDAVVTVLDHHLCGGYYDQGGNCYIEDFTTELEGDNYGSRFYLYGKHFEFDTMDEVKYLQLGVKDK